MSDRVLRPIGFHGVFGTANVRAAVRPYTSADLRLQDDHRRIAQKRLIPRLRESMNERIVHEQRRHPEINWISENVALLPLQRWTVEYSEPDTWFFKLGLSGEVRANLQVDGADDAFAATYQEKTCTGVTHGTLRDVTKDLQAYLNRM